MEIKTKKLDIGDKEYIIKHILPTVGGKDPLRVIKELVENALDANAMHIKIVIRPDELRVVDDGVGMSSRKLAELPTHIGLSEKRLKKLKTMGEKAIGLLSFMMIGNVMEIRSQAEGSDKAYKIVIRADTMEATLPTECESPEFAKRGRRSGTEVIIKELDEIKYRTAIYSKKRETIAKYIAREFFPRLGNANIIVWKDGNSTEVTKNLLPRGEEIYKGKCGTRYGAVEFEIYYGGYQSGVSLFRRGAQVIEDIAAELEELSDSEVWKTPSLNGTIVFDNLDLTADKKAPIRNEKYGALIRCIKSAEETIKERLDEIRSRERRRRRNRALKELAKKLMDTLKKLESEPPTSLHGSTKGEEVEGDIAEGFTTSRTGSKARRTTGKIPIKRGPKKLKALTGGGLMFDEEDFGTPTPRSRFEPNLGVIMVNRRHPDFKKKVELSSEEEVAIDYFYKLAVKELTAHLLGDPHLSEDLEKMIDIQLSMEVSPPKLGILTRRGKRG